MFHYVNPNHRYQFFSPSPFDRPNPAVEPIPVDDEPTDEPKRNLVNALAALYRAYGGEEELNNNAVDIIYKIADVVWSTNNTSDAPSEATGNNDGEGKK